MNNNNNNNNHDGFEVAQGTPQIARIDYNPTGIRVGFRVPETSKGWVEKRCPVAVCGKTDHAHPNGALARAVFYEEVVNFSNPGTLFICVGESNTRPNCLELPQNQRHPNVARRRAPFHFQRPNLDAWDQLRQEDALANVRSGASYGTTCLCDMSLCTHAKHAINEMLVGRDLITVTYVLYDVYPVTLQQLEKLATDSLAYAHANDLHIKVEFAIGLTKFQDYTGSLFGGEYSYARYSHGEICAKVKGNGTVKYGPHPACDFMHTMTPHWGSLVWKMLFETGPNDEVAAYRMVISDKSAPRTNLPLEGYVMPECEEEVEPSLLPLPFALCAELRMLAQGQPRDNRLRAELTRRARRIVTGRDPHVKLTVPEHLREEMVMIAATDALTYISPAEQRMFQSVDQNAASLELHNHRLKNWGASKNLWIPILAFITTVMFKVMVGYGLVSWVPDRYVFLYHLVTAIVSALAVTICATAFSLIFGILEVRRIAWARGWPVHRLFWTYVVLLMFVSAAVAHKPDDYDPFECIDFGSDCEYRDTCSIFPRLRDMTCPTQYQPYHSLQPSKEVNQGAKYKVLEESGHRKSAGPTVFGATSDQHPVSVPAACQCNELIALTNRALLKVPGCAKGAWDEAFEIFAKQYEKLRVKAGETFPIKTIEWSEWLHRPQITMDVRARLETAKDSLADRALETKDYLRNFFVKIEKWVKSEEYAPRAIQGMTDRLQAVIGPFFYSLSKIHNKILSSSAPICYAPGLTAEQIGGWIEEWSAVYPYFYSADAVRFDAHLMEPAFDGINKFYKDYIKAPTRVLDVVKQKVHKAGYTRFGIQYQAEGTRASGDSDTTEGNTDFTLSSTTAALIKQGFQGPGIDFAIIAGGDDQVFVTSRPIDETLYHAYQLSLGMEIELIPATILANVDFYSALPYPSTDGIVMGPKIGRILARLGTSSKPQSDYDAYMYSVAHGLYNMTAHIPMVRTLIWKMMQLGRENEVIVFEAHKMNATHAHGVSDEVYGFLRDRYNISLDVIDQVENEIANIRSFPHIWQHPAIAEMIEVDG